MKENGDSVDLLPFAQQINASFQKQSKVKSTLYENWLVDIYFGPSPAADQELPRLGFMACASTQDKEAGPLPNLSNSNGVRVDFDEKSVVWWSGDSLDDLETKITNAFPEITWNRED